MTQSTSTASSTVVTIPRPDPIPNRKGHLWVPRGVIFSDLSANAVRLYMAFLQWKEHHDWLAKHFKKPKLALRKPSLPLIFGWARLRHTAGIMARRELIDAGLIEVVSGKAKKLRSGFVLLNPAKFIGQPATDNGNLSVGPHPQRYRSARIQVVEAEPTKRKPKEAVEPKAKRSTPQPQRVASPGFSSSTATAKAKAECRAEMLAQYGKTEADVTPGSTFDEIIEIRVTSALQSRGITDVATIDGDVGLQWNAILRVPESARDRMLNKKELAFVEGHTENLKKRSTRKPGEEKYIRDIYTQRVRPYLVEREGGAA
jgi:hypothetical protein